MVPSSPRHVYNTNPQVQLQVKHSLGLETQHDLNYEASVRMNVFSNGWDFCCLSQTTLKVVIKPLNTAAFRAEQKNGIILNTAVLGSESRKKTYNFNSDLEKGTAV